MIGLLRYGRRLLYFVLFLLAWEGLYRLGLLNPLIVGTPGLIIEAASTHGWQFVSALRVTLFEIAVALAIAWSTGIVCGLIIGSRLQPTLILSPILSAAIALPFIVLYPVIVVWTGIGPTSKIIYGVASGFFPIAMATISAMQAIDRSYINMSRAIGANRMQIMTQVMFRLAVPGIISGMRVGTSLVIIAVVTSEMLSSVDGLGFLISYYRSLFSVGHVYLGIILVLLIAAAVNLAMGFVENRFSAWRLQDAKDYC